jgi:lysyl-tRNA synthetase class 2
MRPEVFESGPDAAGLQAMGISEAWVDHFIAAGYESPAALVGLKPSGLREKMNGFRKKNKLDLPALSIEEVESWLNPSH